jgi:hypothetical protein
MNYEILSPEDMEKRKEKEAEERVRVREVSNILRAKRHLASDILYQRKEFRLPVSGLSLEEQVRWLRSQEGLLVDRIVAFQSMTGTTLDLSLRKAAVDEVMEAYRTAPQLVGNMDSDPSLDEPIDKVEPVVLSETQESNSQSGSLRDFFSPYVV